MGLVAAVLVAAVDVPSARASRADDGVVHTGVGSESEARAFPCAPADSGPVVCVPDRGTAWRLTSDATGECTEGVTGWYGDCVRAFDAGDHLRVWGTRGIPPREFRITWSVTRTGADDGAGRDSAPTGTSDRSTGKAAHDGGPSEPLPAPTVASPRSRADGPPGGPHAGPPPAGHAADPADRRRGVPEAAFWDPPITEVPGYSDLLAMPGPTYPQLPASVHARRDAGAPAAAGFVALLAAGWVAWQRSRGGRGRAVG